ncbi:hypothetical protein [Aliiglaciecola sp. NS0011-25]|uniref:hypothetical protein n=1 Tax=Aliiglaciecola sp. NS0011-25 TaxID=3127654 RepID=UPI0031076F4B
MNSVKLTSFTLCSIAVLSLISFACDAFLSDVENYGDSFEKGKKYNLTTVYLEYSTKLEIPFFQGEISSLSFNEGGGFTIIWDGGKKSLNVTEIEIDNPNILVSLKDVVEKEMTLSKEKLDDGHSSLIMGFAQHEDIKYSTCKPEGIVIISGDDRFSSNFKVEKMYFLNEVSDKISLVIYRYESEKIQWYSLESKRKYECRTFSLN